MIKCRKCNLEFSFESEARRHIEMRHGGSYSSGTYRSDDEDSPVFGRSSFDDDPMPAAVESVVDSFTSTPDPTPDLGGGGDFGGGGAGGDW